MSLVSLHVGPSEISEDVKRDLERIARSGLLSESHRGPVVIHELERAVANLRTAMALPPDYGVAFQPSATACMELILRNGVRRRSFHFVHGAFAGRLAATAEQIGLEALRHERAWDAAAAPHEARIPDDVELVAITHNETSTGQRWPWDDVRALRARHPRPLLAIDVTSSFGATAMDWSLGDLWFFSVQKCLGLPAGLGVTLASPRALARARALGPARRVAGWQDLPGIVDQLRGGQTPETPNVLGIALLGRQMARWDLAAIEADTRTKAALVAEAVGDEAFFVRDPAWRSLTSHALEVADPAAWKARAEAAGFALASGYGPLKARCIRIATFPAVHVEQIRTVLAALTA